MDIVSTKMTNSIPSIVMSTMLTNSDDKKVRQNELLYSTHCFISGHITIDNCYYLLSLCKTLVKTKRHLCTNKIKMENNEF